MLELGLRLLFSLAVVVGLLLLLAKLGAKRFQGGADALVQVVHRQALSRTSSVSVVTVGSRVLVLGTTEHQVSVLAELDPEELVDDLALATEAESEAAPGVGVVSSTDQRRRTLSPAPTDGALAGSVLSPATWRRTLAALSQSAGVRGTGSQP